MSAWVEGLLGAVMGGAKEYGDILKEEETAKRKEEEEKRREERALTLAERKADAEQKRKQALEEQERARVAKMMGPESRMTPAASPMEPEGIVQSRIPLEERLKAGIEQAMAEGDQKAAKGFVDQYQTMKEIERKTSEEARKQEEFARGPKERGLTGEAATIQFLAEKSYKGPVDEEGKPEPGAFAKHMANVSEDILGKKTYIRPEREPGVGGEKPPTASQRAVADRALSAALPGLAKTKDVSGKDVVDQQMLSFYRGEVNKIKAANPDAVFTLNETLAAAQGSVESAVQKAKDKAASEWKNMTDADKKATKIESERAYVRKNYKNYISGFLGGAAEEERPDPLGLRKR